MKGKLKAYSTNLEFQIQFQIFRLTWRVSHETLLNQWMQRLSSEIRRIDDVFPDTEVLWTSVFYCVRCFFRPCTPFSGKFSTFCSLEQTEKHRLSLFFQRASHHITLSCSTVDFPHCIEMHALLVKVRIEVNAFLFYVKSKHTVSSYCV